MHVPTIAVIFENVLNIIKSLLRGTVVNINNLSLKRHHDAF